MKVSEQCRIAPSVMGERVCKEEVSISFGCLLHQRQSSSWPLKHWGCQQQDGPSAREEVLVLACARSGAPSVPYSPSSFRASEQLTPKGAAGCEPRRVSRAQGG